MKKKMVTVLLTAAMATAMAAGCGKSSDSGSDKKESYTIGIEQFAEHGSLDNCREGFLKGLEDEGIKEGDNLTVKYKNAAADMGTAKQISDSLVSDKVDLVCAIATPSAQTAYNAAMDTDISVIYTAVTDPKAAELADDKGNPVGEVTGTSDKLPIEAQLKMIRELLPDAKKIGILYTTSEANSVSAIAEYKEKVNRRLELDIKQHASYIANKIITKGLDGHSFYFYILPFNDAETDKKEIMEHIMKGEVTL